jgi:microcystin-dependent protein
MSESLMGSIVLFTGTFAPRDWNICDGRELAISENQALYAIIGTNYGGNGRTSFKLPDLRGRVPMGSGKHIGSDFNWKIGEMDGKETTDKGQILTGITASGSITLSEANLPAHTHGADFTQTSGISNAPAVEDSANSEEPTGNSLALPNAGGQNQIYNTAKSDALLANGTATVTGTVAVKSSGAGAALPVNLPLTAGPSGKISNMQPFTIINYIICVNGIFPARQ